MVLRRYRRYSHHEQPSLLLDRALCLDLPYLSLWGGRAAIGPAVLHGELNLLFDSLFFPELPDVLFFVLEGFLAELADLILLYDAGGDQKT
jgi:hypothetical protein